jgi:hypothetical protein
MKSFTQIAFNYQIYTYKLPTLTVYYLRCYKDAPYKIFVTWTISYFFGFSKLLTANNVKSYFLRGLLKKIDLMI